MQVLIRAVPYKDSDPIHSLTEANSYFLHVRISAEALKDATVANFSLELVKRCQDSEWGGRWLAPYDLENRQGVYLVNNGILPGQAYGPLKITCRANAAEALLLPSAYFTAGIITDRTIDSFAYSLLSFLLNKAQEAAIRLAAEQKESAAQILNEILDIRLFTTTGRSFSAIFDTNGSLPVQISRYLGQKIKGLESPGS